MNTSSHVDPSSVYTVLISKLDEFIDPFDCWGDLNKPLTQKEVMSFVESGDIGLDNTTINFVNEKRTQKEIRRAHLRKVAYFVVNGVKDPISLDVGMPSMGFIPSYIVDDGNHRLLASIIRGEKTIQCKYSGEVDYFINEFKPVLVG